jgi:putative transposase
MANQADFPVRTMCRVLRISASGFYAWNTRAPSARRMANAVLTERIRVIHSASDATYGRPRARAELLEQGERVSHKRKRPTTAVLRLRAQRGELISSANSPSSHALPMAASRRMSS